MAVLIASVANLAGAFATTAVAKTVGKGIIDTSLATPKTVLAAVSGAIVWNLLTWWLGLPSSSSHALIGGLCGAALASANGDWSVIKWSVEKHDAAGHIVRDGLFPKVIVPMITSPIAGLIGGFLIMNIMFMVIRTWRPLRVNRVFGKLQLVSAGYMAWGHGFADAQKTMGIIALATFAATKAPKLDQTPA